MLKLFSFFQNLRLTARVLPGYALTNSNLFPEHSFCAGYWLAAGYCLAAGYWLIVNSYWLLVM
jgi:hypothetical protein